MQKGLKKETAPEDFDMPVLTDSKTEKVAQIIRESHKTEIKRLLVVGCGSGLEAAILAQQLGAEVFGIDIEDKFDHQALEFAKLQTGDAMNLSFADESFDFVFSYHALEHIENPNKALREIHRVLKTGGGFWVGTPNKSRIVGYIGGKKTSVSQKIKWNLMDWKAKFAGKFENEFGAHAGFTAEELRALLMKVFPTVEDETVNYFLTVYENNSSMVKAIVASGLSQFIFPSVYFSGKK
jgi:ubiquinone/menaquinone biosynthesis C-methylase UbiE